MGNRSIDSMIAHLLRCGTRSRHEFNLTAAEMQSLCIRTTNVLLSQPMLLRINVPVAICGDIHGYYHELLRIFDRGGFPPHQTYLFLGDYVDRGKKSLETICLLLAYKVKYPNKFFLLRGNHESKSVNSRYGFSDECVERYNRRLWKIFNNCFDCLPVAAVVKGKIFCCHGGLSPDLKSLDQIENIARPTGVPKKGLLCDLLWSDPSKGIHGWEQSPRGVSVVFGADIVREFLCKHDLKLICRAHELVKSGYKFFANGKLVTVFSVPGYCKKRNDGAIMVVDENLVCTFKLIKYNE